MEEWKRVPNIKNHYEISNNGVVASFVTKKEYLNQN